MRMAILTSECFDKHVYTFVSVLVSSCCKKLENHSLVNETRTIARENQHIKYYQDQSRSVRKSVLIDFRFAGGVQVLE